MTDRPTNKTKKMLSETKNKCVIVLPKMPGVGTIHSEMKRCGRTTCHCRTGTLHGPYYYRYFRQDRRLRKQYVKLSELKAAQAQCEARRIIEQQERRERQRKKAVERAGNEEYRRLVALLKELDKLEHEYERD